jgi:hypothetical protein
MPQSMKHNSSLSSNYGNEHASKRKGGTKSSMDFESSVGSNSMIIMDGGTGSEGVGIGKHRQYT